MQQTKRQEYTYNFRAANLGGISEGSEFPAGYLFFQRCGLRLEPPEDLLQWKNIWTHLAIRLDTSEPGQRLVYFGLGDDLFAFEQDPNQSAESINRNNPNLYVYKLDKEPDANGIIDVQMDLSNALSATRNYAMVIMMVATDSGNNTEGEVLFWKIDGLYTTQEIR